MFITALTSPIGEVAVVRASASYRCGWGSDNVKDTPSLTLPAGEGMRVVVQLAHYQRQIIASTSQIGEVAVVRATVSYKCGWGSDKTNPHPNFPQLGKERALSFD